VTAKESKKAKRPRGSTGLPLGFFFSTVPFFLVACLFSFVLFPWHPMSRPKPAPARLCDLTPGQSGDFFALFAEKTKGATRDGKPFFTCRFRDSRRMATIMVWADAAWYATFEKEWSEGTFFKIRGKYLEHERYGPQIEVVNLRPVNESDQKDGFDPFDFVESTRFNREEMFTELTELAQKNIGDGPLRGLVLTILHKHAEPIKRLPATLRHFHPFSGGLLEHTLAVTRTCLTLVERYSTYYAEMKPPLNQDLVVAGAILHDMGRVVEFGGSTVAVEPTVEGRMFGHLFLGRDLVRDTARELGGVNPELVRMLEHIVVTHLSLPEWGSPRLPLVPECLIIHHADDLDAKLEMYVRCLTRDQEPGPFTARDPVLGRQLYKGRSV
jgi:3'-5' exoribonuclease